MSEETIRALEVIDAKSVKMITTMTKIEVTEQELGTDTIKDMIEALNQTIENEQKEQLRIQSVADEEITKSNDRIKQFQVDLADLQKQLDSYIALSKDFAKIDEGKKVGDIISG